MTPLAPVADSAGATSAAAFAVATPSLILIAPLQIVTLEGRTDPERAWFQATMIVHDEEPVGGAAQMDGAILIVSAVDGPMPQTRPEAETLSIRVQRAWLDPDLVVRFEGVATLRHASGDLEEFPIAGSARPMATNADCLVWDILGSNVDDPLHYVFEAEARIVERL